MCQEPLGWGSGQEELHAERGKRNIETSNGNKIFKWGNYLCSDTGQTLKKNDEFSFVLTSFKEYVGPLNGYTDAWEADGAIRN